MKIMILKTKLGSNACIIVKREVMFLLLFIIEQLHSDGTQKFIFDL